MSGTRVSLGRQMSLDLDEGACTEVFQIDETGQHGEVFTRRWVVELILDLAGFTADRDLATMIAVEPSSRRAVMRCRRVLGPDGRAAH